MHSETAKRALERVCSGAGEEPPSRCYSHSFVDHVNDREYRGLIAEDWSVTDTLGMLRQADLIRSLRMVLRSFRRG